MTTFYECIYIGIIIAFKDQKVTSCKKEVIKVCFIIEVYYQLKLKIEKEVQNEYRRSWKLYSP